MMRALAATLLLAAGAAEAALPARVCVLGDSITAGFAPSQRGWSAPLAVLNAGTDFGVKNVANAGDKVEHAQALFNSDVLGRGCTWVAFLIGTNDLPDGTPSATICSGIDLMMDAAEAEGAHTIGLAILPRGTGPAWTPDLQTRLEGVNTCLSVRVPSVIGRRYVFVDTYNAHLEPASNPPALAAASGGGVDGLHPNNAGQATTANAVQAAVLAAGGW